MKKKVLEILRAASNNNELTMAELGKIHQNYPSKLMNLNSTFEKGIKKHKQVKKENLIQIGSISK